MKSIVLVGSLGASLGFDGLSNEMAGGVGVLVWRLCTNVFTFVALLSVSCCLSSSAQNLVKRGSVVVTRT